MSTKGMRLRSFMASEKLKITREAEENEKSAVGHKFYVSKS